MSKGSGQSGGVRKWTWAAALATALPFVATPFVADLLVPADEELRELSIGLLSALVLIGLAVAVPVVHWVARRSGWPVGSGILVGLAMGLVLGGLSCFSVMEGTA